MIDTFWKSIMTSESVISRRKQEFRVSFRNSEHVVTMLDNLVNVWSITHNLLPNMCTQIGMSIFVVHLKLMSYDRYHARCVFKQN